jgi:hypothetical protein
MPALVFFPKTISVLFSSGGGMYAELKWPIGSFYWP